MADEITQQMIDMLDALGMDTEENRAKLGLLQKKKAVNGSVVVDGERVLVTLGGQRYRLSKKSALNLATGLLTVCKEIR